MINSVMSKTNWQMQFTDRNCLSCLVFHIRMQSRHENTLSMPSLYILGMYTEILNKISIHRLTAFTFHWCIEKSLLFSIDWTN